MVPHESIPRGLTSLSDIDIRGLADTSHERDVHLSVYLPTGSLDKERMNKAFVTSRVKAIRKALTGAIEQEFEATLSMVEDLLFHDAVPGEKGRVLFASSHGPILHVYRITTEPKRLLVLDNSPFILPLAKMLDDYEDYGIILMDSREARLYTVRSEVIELVDSSSIDLMNKHKKGGMSQKRFNRLRRGAIDGFISDVVEDLDRLDDIHDLGELVVAGPGVEKRQLVDALPKHIRDRVIGVIDVDMDIPSNRLLALGEEVSDEQESREEGDALEDLRSAIYKDELAALGLSEVRDALVSGRVDTLLLLDDLSIQTWICERCKRIHEELGPTGTCSDCGGPISSAEVVEELYELAERTGADVEVVSQSPFLETLGGLGAILRY